MIDRLPLNVESLKMSKLGKIIVKLTKEPPNSGKSFGIVLMNMSVKFLSLFLQL